MIDQSASMHEYRDLVVEETNRLVTQQTELQKFEDSLPTLSISLFNTSLDILEFNDLKKYTELTKDDLCPRGLTALYDGLGDTLHKYKDESNNVVYILSDGEENASIRFRRRKLQQTIHKLKTEKNWMFTFLGAYGSQDKVERFAQNISILDCIAYERTREGLRSAYSIISQESRYTREYQALRRRTQGISGYLRLKVKRNNLHSSYLNEFRSKKDYSYRDFRKERILQKN